MIHRLFRRNRGNGNGPLAEEKRVRDGNGDKRVLRVMTYNIHHAKGVDGRYDLGRIAKVIAHENPCIVALQEIEQFRLRSRRDNQPEWLARKLGMNYAFARVREHHYSDNHHHAAYGNAVLSRYPVIAEEHFDITYVGGREPRGCVHATLDIDGVPVHVFCVHLGLRYKERHFQVGKLLSEDIVNNSKFGQGPKILLGDFNNWWPVKSAQEVDLHFRNACIVTGRKRLKTFGKFLSLDYIFASHDTNITSCAVIRSPLAKVASDHMPLLCTVEVEMRNQPRLEANAGAEAPAN